MSIPQDRFFAASCVHPIQFQTVEKAPANSCFAGSINEKEEQPELQLLIDMVGCCFKDQPLDCAAVGSCLGDFVVVSAGSSSRLKSAQLGKNTNQRKKLIKEAIGMWASTLVFKVGWSTFSARKCSIEQRNASRHAQHGSIHMIVHHH